jgi:hypothetical protein
MLVLLKSLMSMLTIIVFVVYSKSEVFTIWSFNHLDNTLIIHIGKFFSYLISKNSVVLTYGRQMTTLNISRQFKEDLLTIYQTMLELEINRIFGKFKRTCLIA